MGSRKGNKDLALVEAKAEYTKHLHDVLQDIVYDKFVDIFNTTKEDTKNSSELLMNFQMNLREVPLWNSNQIQEEHEKVINDNVCPWFSDLLAAIFVSTVKILTSVKMNKSKHKVQIKMPKTEEFIHKVYSLTAHRLFDDPYLFSTSKYSNTIKNKHEVVPIISHCIEETIRTMLPFQSILETCVSGKCNDTDSENESESEEEEPDDYNPEDEEPAEEPFLPDPEDYTQQEQTEILPSSAEEVQFEADPMQQEPQMPIQQEVQQLQQAPQEQTNGFFDPPQTEVKQVPVIPKSRIAPQQQCFFPDATS